MSLSRCIVDETICVLAACSWLRRPLTHVRRHCFEAEAFWGGCWGIPLGFEKNDKTLPRQDMGLFLGNLLQLKTTPGLARASSML